MLSSRYSFIANRIKLLVKIMVAKEVQPKSNLEALRKIRQLLVITCPDAEETLLLVANNIYGAMGSNSQLITEQLYNKPNFTKLRTYNLWGPALHTQLFVTSKLIDRKPIITHVDVARMAKYYPLAIYVWIYHCL